MLENCPPNPLEAFKTWFEDLPSGEPGRNAFSLATVNEVGQPSVRILNLQRLDLLRGVFVFVTNLESRKARDILTNPHVGACFYWPSQKRQVCIEGVAYTISEDESDLYFEKFPFPDQLGLWASKQSKALKSREKLEHEIAALAKKFGDGPIPRPPHWSGFCIQPTAVEFWQEKPFQLHDRILYTPSALHESGWEIRRVYP
jgi:pyridoxamine 5'-phosphate oxidase